MNNVKKKLHFWCGSCRLPLSGKKTDTQDKANTALNRQTWPLLPFIGSLAPLTLPPYKPPSTATVAQHSASFHTTHINKKSKTQNRQKANTRFKHRKISNLKLINPPLPSQLPKKAHYSIQSTWNTKPKLKQDRQQTTNLIHNTNIFTQYSSFLV